MKRLQFIQITWLTIYLLIALTSTAQQKSNIAGPLLFDAGWRFKLDSTIDASDPTFNDASWRKVELPHDWSIEDLEQQIPGRTSGPFDKQSVGNTATGFVVGGTGWYRKSFSVSNAATDKVYLQFDGVYMISNVWINGHLVGVHHYGYTPFNYEISKWLNPAGQQNVVAVKVENRGRNSRWYSGSGIYRHVWLTKVDQLHIQPWGVFITTPNVTGTKADIVLRTAVNGSAGNDYRVMTTIVSPTGEEVAKIQADAADSVTIQKVSLNSPALWSLQNPNLYKAKTQLLRNNEVTDEQVNSFGIRDLSFTAAEGFKLNGEKILLQGGCIHHDNGPLGSATIDRAEERKIEVLKRNGFNAIRTSHNPPSKQLLDACDRLGMFVIDEAFDMWERPKNPQDYANYFKEDWQQDLSSVILRDRNHPSVITWSIGNEINERVDTSGLRIEAELKSLVKQFDNTRPVTEAICSFWDHPGTKWEATAPAFAMLDIGGYNYALNQYEPDHKEYPERMMIGTESVPLQSLENWNMVEKHPYVLGDFVWTAFDYMGETAIGHTTMSNEKDSFSLWYPWYNAWCGDLDITGDKKPQSYYRDVVWHRSPVEIAVHVPLPDTLKEKISYWGWPDELKSWTWPGMEGKKMNVRVFSRAKRVRLLLNGKQVGEKPVPDSSITTVFDILYQPGELKAIALDDTKEAGTVSLQTAGAPKQIRLIADRPTIRADRNDLCYITAEIIDAHGNIDPNAQTPVRFSVSGNGELLATGSASPTDAGSFRSASKKTFRGKCIAIIRPNETSGTIKVTASADGLESAAITIYTK